MRIYFVVGTPNARKSSLIRALSGIGTAKNFVIALEDGTTINVWVRASSVQEGGHSGRTVEELLAYLHDIINKHGVDAVLVPLWTKATSKFPGYLDYIQACADEGWDIGGIAELSTNEIPNPLIINGIDTHVIKIPDSKLIPANQIAATVRQEWGWV